MNLSDPKDCLYCQNNQTLHELMIEIAPLSVSRLFLFKEQTYRGRCLVAYKDHARLEHAQRRRTERIHGRCRTGDPRDAESIQSTKDQLRRLFG